MSQNRNFDVAFSTIAGSSFPNFLEVFKGRKTDSKYLKRKIFSGAVSAVSEPFRWWEELRYGNVIKNTPIPDNPVFILGHWRSGTTLLHNLMCQDPQFAFVTTYQGVFPNLLLGSKWLFKNIMKQLTPDKRPSDNMALSPDFPQEEEFALGNMNPYSLYHFWYFPNHIFDYYEKYIRFNGVSDEVKQRWVSDYKILVKKSLLNHNKQQFISKNPPHTGRIKILLEAFPNAKFIYIYRNPIVIFESTRKLITSTIPALQFQQTADGWAEASIFELYKRIISDYENAKSLIPEGNLVEVKFESFETDLIGHLKHIYDSLQLSGYENALPHFKAYANAQKKYEKNSYNYSKEKVAEIISHWEFSMKQYGYELPENMILV